MPRAETRASSRGKFQYQELSYNPRRRARISLSPVRGVLVVDILARSLSTPPAVRTQPRLPSSRVNRTLIYMALPRVHAFATFNGGSPLLLAQRHDMPVSTLKSLPDFTGETSVSPLEHIQEVANVCNIHGVTEDDVVVRLLATSFKGKALQWYRGLAHSSIANWDELGAALCKHFKDKSDHLSLLEKLTTIKRAPHEYMTDFNCRFQKTWDRIPDTVKPTPGNAFLHYLRAFNSDIATTIQTMGGDTLPNAYEIAIKAENILIQGGKLAPRPPMPFFPDIPNHQPAVAPIPTTSTSQALTPIPKASTSSSGIDELKEMLQGLVLNTDKREKSLDKRLKDQERKLEDSVSMMQKMSNKVVALERQQAQGSRPPQLQYQNQGGGRPSNQWNGANDQNRQNSHAAASSSNQNRAMVPQNNLAQDQDFCPSCNYSYLYCMCQKEESYLALTISQRGSFQGSLTHSKI